MSCGVRSLVPPSSHGGATTVALCVCTKPCAKLIGVACASQSRPAAAAYGPTNSAGYVQRIVGTPDAIVARSLKR